MSIRIRGEIQKKVKEITKTINESYKKVKDVNKKTPRN